MESHHLKRFLDAHNQVYLKALAEIRNGKKETHWMWFLFPQLKGLGKSDTAQFYGIADLKEAEDYLQHPVLGRHLIEISEALLVIEDKTAHEIFGTPDDLKLRSSMTLFANATPSPSVFAKVLNRYFDGMQDEMTLQLIVRSKLKHDII